ncbi:MAG TPA: SGNH/GDSL hydrolase family protein [Terrimesophilobacter sp.]|nr:SGNH/GDSL hydrolase family protein [Terrimesophilobacter sp.]
MLPLHVAAGVKSLQVVVASNSIAGTGGSADSTHPDFGLAVFVDGVYSTRLQPAADGVGTVLNLALDGAAHDIDLVQGWRAFRDTGTYLVSYDSLAASPRAVAAPARRLAFYGDSILSGAYAYPGGSHSAVEIVRAGYPGRVACETWGGRALYNDANGPAPGLGSISALAARLVALVQLGGATTTRELWVQIGVNDWLVPYSTAAAFGTSLAALFDAVHALDPTIRIWACQPAMLSVGQEATNNANGEKISAFRTQYTTAGSGRAWVTVVAAMTVALDPDGIHPSDAGQQDMGAQIKVVIGV